uniref:immunoglobulin superfamily member 2-like isoform X2 n=1 Tax=Epinephelus lanceolatus TaxID=310571 RepID=UPI0014460C4A|nr:immunoglobulin superfamily member 2-like isoform X2 [Epinephelus lanceolatus]
MAVCRIRRLALVFVFMICDVCCRGQVFSPHLGQNITLTCQVSNSATIVAVWWARRDLKSEYVFYYRDGQSDTDIQHPSFQCRVVLAEDELKDGNLSVVLMNVNSSDYGEYTCGFKERKEGTVVKNEFTCNITLIKPDQHVTVHPGDNVTLRCEAGDVSILAVEWTRPDLEPQYVLLNRDGHFDTTFQHPSFTGRVEVEDRKLKDGDVSLTLKNVTSRDSGTYECRVKSGGSRLKKRAILKTDPITVIRLEVTGSKNVNFMDGNFPRGHVGLAAAGVVAVLLLAAGVSVAVWKHKRCKDQRSAQSAADEAGNKQLMSTSAV